MLDKQGALLIAEREGIPSDELDWRPSDSQLSDIFLRHTLAVNEVRVSVEESATKNGFEIVKWLDEKTLKGPAYKEEIIFVGVGGKRQRGHLYPDGYFCLHDGSYFYHFFLEVDLATESIQATSAKKRDFLRKVHFYRAYQDSGQFARKYNADQFVVLTVAQGEVRTNNLKTAAEEFDQNQTFWFTSLGVVRSADLLTEHIWQVAGWPVIQSLLDRTS